MICKVYAFVDPGTRLTAVRFWIPEWNRNHEAVITREDCEEMGMASRVIQLLDGWGTNIMAIEYNPDYREPIRQQGSWGQQDFKGLLKIITEIRQWALDKGIDGYSIYPKEIMDERVRGNYCWRHYWEPKDDEKLVYCAAHKKDCGDSFRQVKHRDEVDCKIIEKVFTQKIMLSDDLLIKRKKLFERPWNLIGSYKDNSNRNTRLENDRNKQKEKTNEPKDFMF